MDNYCRYIINFFPYPFSEGTLPRTPLNERIQVRCQPTNIRRDIIEALIDLISNNGKNEIWRGRLKYLRISRVQNSGGKHAWVRSQAGDRVQRTKKRVPEKFRGSWKGKWNARIRGMPTVRLAISLPRPISSHYPAVSQPCNTQPNSRSLPPSRLCHGAASFAVSRDAPTPSNREKIIAF